MRIHWHKDKEKPTWVQEEIILRDREKPAGGQWKTVNRRNPCKYRKKLAKDEEKLAHEQGEAHSRTRRQWHKGEEKLAHEQGETGMKTRKNCRLRTRRNRHMEKPTREQTGMKRKKTRRNRHQAQTYLQLPLQQWGAGNVYLLVLSGWKVNIAENPIAVKGL